MHKTILITGATDGIGRLTAQKLANDGHKVLLHGRSKARLEEVAEQIGGAQTFLADFSDLDEVAAMATLILTKHDKLDVLINNAGVEAGAKTYTMIDDEDWDYVFDTNLKAAWRLSKFYTQWVAKQGGTGSIVNIASITAYRTIKGQFPYAVSKAALVKATEIMALEGARYGVRVNALAPGYILTDVSRVLLESERSSEFVKGIPMRRYGEFSDLDGPLLLLASDASTYMTGSVVVVDGGHICAEL